MAVVARPAGPGPRAASTPAGRELYSRWMHAAEGDFRGQDRPAHLVRRGGGGRPVPARLALRLVRRRRGPPAGGHDPVGPTPRRAISRERRRPGPPGGTLGPPAGVGLDLPPTPLLARHARPRTCRRRPPDRAQRLLRHGRARAGLRPP